MELKESKCDDRTLLGKLGAVRTQGVCENRTISSIAALMAG